MEPVLRASLATLAALSILGGLSALLRPPLDHGRDAGLDDGTGDRRHEKLGLLLHHTVALGVAVAALVGAWLGGGDGRPLFLCAVGPLLVLCLHDAVSRRVALLSFPLVALGLVADALIVLGVAPPFIAGPASAVVAVAVCAAAALVCLVRRRSSTVARVRAMRTAQAIALFVAAFAAALGTVPTESGAGLWAIGFGAAGALGTAARLQPTSPPGVRELVSGAVVFSMALAASAAAPLHVDDGVVLALFAALVSMAVFALVRATVDVARVTRPAPAKEPALFPSLPNAQALGAMAPLLDDALLRRPGRPRVIARVPARRLLDAALDRARSAQPKPSNRKDDGLRVDVVAGDSDIDVDGDPADLAEALCAVLDNALRSRAQNPDVKVQVHLRGSPASVTFEISDSLPDGMAHFDFVGGIPDADAPFLHPRADVERPGLGVSLARARVLVERNGGKLLTRSSAEGSTVQVTMPRRMQKGAVGQA